MKAVLRLKIACWAAALALAPMAVSAQETPSAPPASSQTTNAPPSDTVGPRELQNFNLSGRVTRQADAPVAAPAARETRTQTPVGRTAGAPTSAPATAPAPARTRVADSNPASRAEVAAADPAPVRTAPIILPTVTSALPEPAASVSSTFTPATPGFSPAPDPVTSAPQSGFDFVPWLLAAIALLAGGAFLLWRSRSREAFAGGPRLDGYAPPEPAPRPVPPVARAPAPAPKASPAAAPAGSPAPAPALAGLVSTRLRPWVEIAINPLRCVVDEHNVTIEFEAELFNSGSAPARAVLAEASLLNAGPAQDQELAAFFANPVGSGERIAVLAPLKRLVLRSKVVTPLAQVQAYELGGHQAFVPVIAFNVLYGWSSSDGQTSASYLLGRSTDGDKIAPFRLDLGPRIFRGLAARLLPTGLRK